MWSELLGVVPNFPVPYAKTCINRAWRDIRRHHLWSFQLYEYNWIVPAVVSSGTVSVTRGSSSVVVDATAQTAINAIGTLSNVIQRQFRTGSGRTIYNITAWDTATLTLSLDRPYGESTSASSTYQIFQIYYPAPYQDHLTFITVRNQEQFRFLVRTTRESIDLRDPQRTWTNLPTHYAPYKIDANANSPSYGHPMYEIWGLPLSTMTFQLYGIRKLTDFTAASDTPPVQVGEDCIISLAKVYVYEWAEAQRGDLAEKSPDWKFLMGAAMADHRRLLKDYTRQDREIVNSYFSSLRLNPERGRAYYNGLANIAYPGLPW